MFGAGTYRTFLSRASWRKSETPFQLIPTSVGLVVKHACLVTRHVRVPCVPIGVVSGKVPLKNTMGVFPGGAVVENPPANAGDTGSSPGLGRSHMPRSN